MFFDKYLFYLKYYLFTLLELCFKDVISEEQTYRQKTVHSFDNHKGNRNEHSTKYGTYHFFKAK